MVVNSEATHRRGGGLGEKITITLIDSAGVLGEIGWIAI
jgi:hypothetical protein